MEKTYWECSHHVICCATKSIRTSLHSLVDRRDNGGTLGRYGRVIETHPESKVDIRGIDNHHISAMPLATTGGVTTMICELIVIMH